MPSGTPVHVLLSTDGALGAEEPRGTGSVAPRVAQALRTPKPPRGALRPGAIQTVGAAGAGRGAVPRVGCGTHGVRAGQGQGGCTAAQGTVPAGGGGGAWGGTGRCTGCHRPCSRGHVNVNELRLGFSNTTRNTKPQQQKEYANCVSICRRANTLALWYARSVTRAPQLPCGVHTAHPHVHTRTGAQSRGRQPHAHVTPPHSMRRHTTYTATEPHGSWVALTAPPVQKYPG